MHRSSLRLDGRFSLLVVSLFAAACGMSAKARAADRPNFIFIYTDDQRWDALGVVQREQGEQGRFPWVESPNLDRLASEGVRFRNAFVVTSLCAPSRAAFLTGRYGHLNGVVDNHTDFPVDSVTHASLLREAGYRTAYVGKWHMGGQSGQRPGFDFSASFIGQGVYFDCPIEVNGVKTPSEGFVDDVSTDYAVNFITENKDRPFSLVLGYKTCHGPFTPPPRTAETYGDAEARATPNLEIPAIYKDAAYEEAKGGKLADKSKTILGMLRGLRAIDENVGKLLAKLDELKLTENTVVVYSSDNGYYLGEHGLGDKRTAYDESLRIPLLVRYPKVARKGVTVDAMALNIDLAPTFLDLAGVSVPKSMQGRSWRPLLTDASVPDDWRHSYFYEYFREGRSAAPTVTAVRTDAAKLVRYPGHDDWTEMFDLKADPYETKNLINDPAHATMRKRLEAEYDRQAAAVDFKVPEFADERKQPQKPKPLNAWVLDYRFDKKMKKGDEQDRIVDASGHKNDGTAEGTKVVDNGREFDGKGYVSVEKSPSLDPSAGAFAIEATFRADAPDGIVLARGGKSSGYALYLVEGKPTFTYLGDARKTIAGKKSIEGRKVVVTARVTDGQMELLVDGKEVAQTKLRKFLERDPNDVMQIGADRNSPVLDEPVPAFRGVIERVRIYSGTMQQ
jgi:arylsulfatase A-like enzyme